MSSISPVFTDGPEMPEQDPCLDASTTTPPQHLPEAFYERILSIAADAIISTDPSQRIILFNDGAEAIFGWSADEIIGKPLDILLPGRFGEVHRERHIPSFAAAAVDARLMGERREIFGLRRNGEEFPAEASISRIGVGGDQFFTVVLRDVTGRKRAEAAQRFLAEAGMVLSSSLDLVETLRALAKLAVTGLADFAIVDLVREDGSVHRVELAHRNPGKETLARRLLEFPLDRSRPHLTWKALQSGRAVLVPEVTEEFLDSVAQNSKHREVIGEVGLVSYIAAPIGIQDRLLAVILLASTSRRYDGEDLALAEEVTRRAALALDHARLYDEAQRAIRARDQIVGIVAHDLGNPLSVVRILTSLIKGVSPDPEYQQHISAIQTSARQMERLISRLLDLRRIEAGRLVLEYRAFAPATLVEELGGRIEILARERGLDVTITLDDSVPAVLTADRDALLQVLDNLAGNAVNVTPPGGRIHIQLRASDHELRFEVEDTGPGITREDAEHVFERYWQAQPSTRKGIGLGLAIARGIVEAHGGRIWAETGGERQGARFCFTIPSDASARARPMVSLSE
jgi:PAS domain S-box-containing protein